MINGNNYLKQWHKIIKAEVEYSNKVNMVNGILNERLVILGGSESAVKSNGKNNVKNNKNVNGFTDIYIPL